MRGSRREVVVTGLGLVSPLGDDLCSFWQQLTAGTSAVGPIRRFDASGYPTRIAAEVKTWDQASSKEMPELVRSQGRIGTYAGAAARSAWLDSGLPVRLVDEPVGLVLAAGLGVFDYQELVGPCSAASADPDSFDESILRREMQRALRPWAIERRSPGALAAGLAEWFGFSGPTMAVMTACSAGTQAIDDAARWIRNGLVDVALCGASDSEICPLGLASFCLLGALSKRNEEPQRASRPFDAERDGFVLGEGAGFLVLEELTHAERRKATIYAQVAGVGSACDSYRVTDPHPEGKGAIAAMRKAMAQAGVEPGEIGCINAHGTSTVQNDRIETSAIRQVFGDKAASVPVSSNKSMMGHLTVAAGAVEAIATVLTLVHQTIPPTINYQNRDIACDLDYVPNRCRKADIRFALSNSFAFGGHCASVLFER